MESMVKWVALTYGIAAVIVLTPEFARGDQACMKYPYDSCTLQTCCKRFTSDKLTTLYVDVNCSHPEASRIIDPVTPLPNFVPNSPTCKGVRVVHEFSCLTAFPENYCKYTATREISLRYNNIPTLPDFKCVPHLGKLDLSHNKLTRLTRDAFRGLTYIKEIFLDYNDISYIHPLALDNLTELSIFSVSNNHLLTVDSWAINSLHPFCVINLSHNKVQQFSNQAQWKFNKAQVYGPGFVDLSYNRLEGDIGKELNMYGIDSILLLAKYIRWGFDLRHNPLRCDCHSYEAVKWARSISKFIWRDYFNVTCYNPPKLRGTPVPQLPLEALVCNVTFDCPSGCYCESQPARKTMLVLCDGQDLQQLPEALPKGKHLVIHMANNSLDIFQPRHYLERTKRIDLRGNGLRVIHKDTPHLLRKAKMVDLRDNDLHHLPSTLQVLDPGVVLLDLHTLKCSCDLSWMSAWLDHGHSRHLQNITCTKDDGKTLLLFNTTVHNLCDRVKVEVHHSNYKIFMIATLSILALMTIMLVVFRHEVLVSCQVCQAQSTSCQRKQAEAALTPPQFDIFISMNVTSESDSRWVNDVLLPHLQRRGLACYYPLRDCPIGSVEMDEMIKRMQDSTTALVVLSRDYVESPACLFQFKQAYSYMVAQRQGNLLVIRRGSQLSRHSVPDPRLRAMVTLRMFCTEDMDHLPKALDKLYVQRETEM